MLASEAQVALAEVAARHGLTVKVGGGKYDPNTGTFAPKVEFAMKDAGQNEFIRSARSVGLAPDDFGKTFLNNGQTFRITGINLRAPKYPIKAMDVISGRQWRFPERVVQGALGREVTPEVPIFGVF